MPVETREPAVEPAQPPWELHDPTAPLPAASASLNVPADAPPPGDDPAIGRVVDAVKAVMRLMGDKCQLWKLPSGRVCLALEPDQALGERLEPLFAKGTLPAVLNGAPLPASPPERLKLLLVEDDALSLQLLCMILAQEPRYEVFTAANGRLAWEMLDRGLSPDLCISDINMPEMDGLQLLERMRADTRFKETPALLCTALKDRQTVARAAPLRVSYYLLKPYSGEAVLAQLRRLLR